MEKDGPLDGRKYNENSQDSQIGQVTPKKFKVTSDRVCNKFMARFHQRSTYNFYACRSQKRKKDSQVVNLFYAFGIYKSKSCT